MRYLVTGGLGVVGSKFVALALEDKENEVTIVDAAESPRNHFMWKHLASTYGDRVKFVIERIEKYPFGMLLRDHDRLLHAAAHTGIPHSSEVPNDDWLSNVDATKNILDYMLHAQVKIPTVMLSSVKPYATPKFNMHVEGKRWVLDGVEKNGLTEQSPLEPDEPYAASKMAQSAIAQAYARTFDLPITVLRCSNLYGDAPCHGPRHGWLTWLCICAAMGWTFELQGTGFQTRDMLFTDDVAKAVFRAFGRMPACQGEVFNVGGGKANTISVLEACELAKVETSKGEGRKHEDMCVYVDHSKFTTATGWSPKIQVDEGMARIIAWAKDHSSALDFIYQDAKK